MDALPAHLTDSTVLEVVADVDTGPIAYDRGADLDAHLRLDLDHETALALRLDLD